MYWDTLNVWNAQHIQLMDGNPKCNVHDWWSAWLSDNTCITLLSNCDVIQSPIIMALQCPHTGDNHAAHNIRILQGDK